MAEPAAAGSFSLGDAPSAAGTPLPVGAQDTVAESAAQLRSRAAAGQLLMTLGDTLAKHYFLN